MSFEPGDIVKLKSGGEKMTVEYIQEDGKVTCVWSVDRKVERDSFDPVVLKEYKSSGAGAVRGFSY
jgi:uncharacterized protein YodC (DUF2158 family)